MRGYIIINKLARTSRIVSLDEAASIAGLDPSDIELALEEEGNCETSLFIIADYARLS